MNNKPNDTIVLPASQRDTIRDYYVTKLEELKAEVKVVESILSTLSPNTANNTNRSIGEYQAIYSNGEYDKTWSNFQKALFIMNKMGGEATTAKIVDTIISDYEPEKKGDRKQLISTISSTMVQKEKKKKLKLYRNNSGENVYSIY